MTTDFVRVDRNVQAIRNLEATWTMPALPDMVRLDIATQAQTPEQAVEFLGGLEGDLRRADERDRQVPMAEDLTNQLPQPDRFPQLRTALNLPQDPTLSVGDQVNSLWRGLTGQAAPIKIDSQNSVRHLKQRAVDLGYLDENTVIDDRWDPNLRNVQFEMSRDDFADQISGDRPGSFSIDTVAGFMEDWMTPTGLLRAAVDLDFLPDVERIGEEASGWGDKWRKFFDTKSPRDLVDAMTGPLDDLIVPIINTGLLFTGVGNVAMFVRGSQLMKASHIFQAIPGGRYLKSGLIATDRIQDAAQPSFLSSGLSRFSQGGNNIVRTAAGASSSTMDAWRNLAGVKASKSVIREGMRLGLASQVEQSLLPGFDGKGLGDIETVEQWADSISQHPLTWGVGEMFFTPTRLFSPLAAPADDTADALATLGRVTDNDNLTFEFESGVDAWLRTNDPERYGRLEAARQKYDTRAEAMAETLLGDSTATEELGAVMGWVTVAAALESEAARAAALRFHDDVSRVWTSAGQPSYHKARNHLINQIRAVDADNLDDIVQRLAEAEALDDGTDLADKISKWRQRARENPDELRAFATDHNERIRRATVNQLIGKGLEQGALEAYLPRVMDRLGNWNEFTESLGTLRDNLGRLTDVRYAPARSAAGGPIALVDGDEFARIEDAARPFNETFDEIVPPAEGLSEVDGILSDQLRREKGGGLFAPLARNINTRGRFTVQRLDTATKQEMLTFLSEGERIVKYQDDLEAIARTPAARQALADAVNLPEGLNRQQFSDAVQAIVANTTGFGDSRGGVKRLARYMRSQGISVDDVKVHLQLEADRFAADPRWSERFGIADGVEVMTDAGQRRLRGPEAGRDLKAKLKEGKALSKFRAAEVDLTGELGDLAEQLERSGYRLVHGVDYLQPDDLLDLVPEFAELSNRTRWKRSIGNFFGRQESGKLAAVNTRVRTKAAYDELAEAARKGQDVRLDLSGASSPDLQRVQEDLNRVVRKVHEEAQEKLDLLGSKPLLSRFSTRVSIASEGVPYNIADLSNFRFKTRFIEEMTGAELAYTRDEAEAIWRSLKKGRQLSFQERGLVNIEDHFRANPQLTNAMKLLGGGRTTLGADLAGAGNLRRVTEASKLVAAQATSAGIGAVAGAQFDDEGDIFSAEGAIGAVLGVAGGVAAGRKLATKFDDEWSKYAYLADNLAYARDQLRFALSPIFDISRYTEAALLTKVGDTPDGVRYLSLSDTSPRLHRRSLRKEIKAANPTIDPGDLEAQVNQIWDNSLTEFRELSLAKHGWDQSVVDDLSRWYRSVGIAGFDTSAWMTATFASMRRQGVAADEAYDAVVRTFTYGTTGRSAAELSMNFVFFPFSFTKKTLGHVTRFLGDDLSRAAVLHDYFKYYEILNERYDLTERFRDQMPFIRRLNRLNLFAYGTSLGEFGGPNRPLIDFSTALGGEVAGLFMPFAGDIRTGRDGAELKDLTQRLLPVWSDMENMLADGVRQGEVFHGMFSGDRPALTREAEARRAVDEWNEFKREMNDLMKSAGIEDGYAALRRTSDPRMEALRQVRDQKRQELLERYPAWAAEQAEQIETITLRNIEAEQWARLGAEHVAEGRTTREAGFFQMQTLHDQIWGEGGYASSVGVSINNIEDLPVEMQTAMRGEAEKLSAIPGFLDLYRRYFERYYGPIELRTY